MAKIDIPSAYRAPPTTGVADRRKKPVEKPPKKDSDTKRRPLRKKPDGSSIDEYV